MLQMRFRGLRLGVGCDGASQCLGDGLRLTKGLILALLHLMDGLLAEAGAKRCLYFFP